VPDERGTPRSAGLADRRVFRLPIYWQGYLLESSVRQDLSSSGSDHTMHEQRLGNASVFVQRLSLLVKFSGMNPVQRISRGA
jgi:hypothetical protein